MNTPAAPNDAQATRRVRQPAGFSVLFLTEMWERFGFYLVTSLLLLYLVKMLGYADKQAYATFAAFSALLYITPAIGGYLADRFLGYRRTLLLGVVLLVVGYGMLIIPSARTFFPALAFVIMGTGFF